MKAIRFAVSHSLSSWTTTNLHWWLFKSLCIILLMLWNKQRLAVCFMVKSPGLLIIPCFTFSMFGGVYHGEHRTWWFCFYCRSSWSKNLCVLNFIIFVLGTVLYHGMLCIITNALPFIKKSFHHKRIVYTKLLLHGHWNDIFVIEVHNVSTCCLNVSIINLLYF